MIIGSVAAILVSVWFYNTASRSGRNPLHWAIAGFVVYFIVALCWTYFINPGIKDLAMHGRNTLLMYISKYAYIVVAVACSVFFNMTVGKKKDVE
jgi:hypothetical protein